MNKWIGILAGIFTSMSLLPQLVKMIKEKKPGDISVAMFLILLVGVGLWVVYGFLQEDWPIAVTNGLSFVINVAILCLHLYYKRKG